MFPSRFMPCATCGASVERTASQVHDCDPERTLDYQMFRLREEVGSFERRFQAYLTSNLGRFEAWLAAREIRGV